MGKIFWCDCETTGVDPRKNSVIQIAGLVEIDGEVVEEINLLCKPLPGKVIAQQALDVNKRTAEEICQFPHPMIAVSELRKIWGKYVNKYEKSDKFTMAGFRVDFDFDFVRQLFMDCKDKFFGSWFINCTLDVRAFMALAASKHNICLENYKLVTCCEHFEIPLGQDAHDAMPDIKATRQLFKELEVLV